MEFQYKEMGTRIKVRRKELKIKQAELAEALEISNNHIAQTIPKTAICFHNFAFPAFLAFYVGISLTFFHFLTSSPKSTKKCLFIQFFCIFLTFIV